MSAPFQLTPQATEDLDGYLVVHRTEKHGVRRPSGEGDHSHVPSVGSVSVDRTQKEGRHNVAGTFLDAS